MKANVLKKVRMIKMFDSHIHTDFSTDSKMKISEAVEASKKAGFNLIITEHMDLNYPDKDKFIFNPEEYFSKFKKYKSDKLLLGIELGMRMDYLEQNKNIQSNYDFDYVIGSIHFVDDMDIFYDALYKDRNKKDAYDMYFNRMYECVKNYDFFDSLGHIDYIARYARYEDKEIYYPEFSDEIDEILKILAYRGNSIEINTRRFNDPYAVENLLPIYKRFKELGGKTVTVGSDAHTPSSVGNCINTAVEIANECGLKIVYYRNRKPNYDKF
jgi:histidinol-phosphatase (PHP family)